MELLVDLFGYLSIVLHGLTILAQSVAIGSVFFWAVAARPLAPRLADTGSTIVAGAARIAVVGALTLIVAELASIGLQSAVLVDTVGLAWTEVLPANFVLAGLAKVVCATAIIALLFTRPHRASAAIVLIAAVAELGAATLTTHAAARLSNRPLLLLAEWLHQAGAAIWIGGLPCFMFALSHARGNAAWQAIGSRFSRISMGGVGCILLSGATMSLFYIGDLEGFYGTAYGVMVGAKIALFLMLLGLGSLNFLLIEKLRADPATPIQRLKCFAATEFGLGISIFFAAASLTSVPPAVDLTQDRVSWSEIIERNTPVWPRLSSPDHDRLALPALQKRLDADAARLDAAHRAAFIPGAGDLPPRNAADIAWSEYNHHWAGVCVALIGLLALLNQAGLRLARHWPLLFLGLAVFLFFRSDPETWPMGDISFVDSLRDVEVLQHRLAVLLLVAFAVFEWRVRTRERSSRWALRMFPLLCVVGGTLLLTHSHAIANVKDQLLIELTHTPLALAGIVAGWARWVEIELDPRANPIAHKVASWTWPVAILFCGLVLLLYREA
mgnify:CR=1 FL=1